MAMRPHPITRMDEAILARGRLREKLAKRLDAEALEQLRAEVGRLGAENDELRDRLYWAEQDAESWRRDATDMHLQLCKTTGGCPGITQDGALVVVPGDGDTAEEHF